MKQIGKKYSRQQALHHAEHQELQEASSNTRLKDHHIISESRNMPVPLFEFVRANLHIPAMKVYSFLFFVYGYCLMTFSCLFLNCRTIFLVVCLSAALIMVVVLLLQKMTETQFVYGTI